MKKGIFLVIIGVLLITGVLGGLSYVQEKNSYDEFISSGYILNPSTAATVTNDAYSVINFAEGEKYRERYNTQIDFADVNGNDNSISKEHFIHYTGGSLGSFTKGSLVDVSKLTEENNSYYSISKKTVLVKQGDKYELKCKGENVAISEFLWKISDNDYMLGSSAITLHINNEDVLLNDYAQITYVDKGVVRISHEDGTYQTVAEDSTLTTASGQSLNLVGKGFCNSDGEIMLSLEDLAVEDNNYIQTDENTDAPAFNLPKFVVEDGESGDVGTEGVEGDEGGEGDEGDQGDYGSYGEHGNGGNGGKSGSGGGTGSEGDTGGTGYDGKEGDEGEEGEDATNANDSSDLASVDVNLRPSVSLASEYKVSSNSAQMTLVLNDPDDSLVRGENGTRVVLYNKDTMEKVNSDVDQLQYGAMLENTGTAALSFDNLDPDTNYLLIVNGQYVALDGVRLDIVMFDKEFRTDAIGVSLEKYEVTEGSVAVKAKVVDSTITSYGVQFFWYKNGVKEEWATYTYNTNMRGSGDQTISLKKGVEEQNKDKPVESNTTYYAQIVNLQVEGNTIVNTDGTIIELQTLKKKPFDENKDENGNTVYVSGMQTELSANERTRTLTVSLPDKIVDPDNGITGYTYQLFKEDDYKDAEYNISNCEPAFSKTTLLQSPVSFTLENNDNSKYYARVIITFNNNESIVEYTTMLSEPKGISSDNSSLLVTIEEVNRGITDNNGTGHPDALDGFICINDQNKQLMPNVNDTQPMLVVITGEYEDIHTQKINKIEDSQKTGENEAKIHFRVDGLHPDGAYTIVVYGPYNYEGDTNRVLSESERETYLAGAKVSTTEAKPFSLVSAKVNNSTEAFAYAVNFTTAAEDSAENAPESYIQYELGIMEKVEFTLFHIREDESVKNLGTASYVDIDKDEYNQNSDFEEAYISRQASNKTSDRTLALNPEGYNLSTDAYVLTPSKFGLDTNDTELYTGGKFEIVASSGYDYSGNSLPFNSTDGEDRIIFDIKTRHLQSIDPNTEVSTTLISNEEAASGFEKPELSKDTIVGLRFSSNYGYTDYDTSNGAIEYTIYKLTSDKTTDAIDGLSGNGSMLIYENKDDNNGIELEEVLTARTNYTGTIELYFDGTQTNGQDIKWYNSKNQWVNDPDNRQTILKRGERYIITYKVYTDGTIKCQNGENKDVYPQCVYENKVPLYRSSVIDTVKQEPKVERYLCKSGKAGTDKNTYYLNYKYHIIDPDNAIKSTDGKCEASVNGYTSLDNYSKQKSSFSKSYSIELSRYKEAFEEATKDENLLKITGLSGDNINGYFYTVSIPYQLESAGETKYIVSTPDRPIKEPAKNDIVIQGSDSTKPVVNESGYRYKITLKGQDISNYVALRVKIEGLDNNGDPINNLTPVIYDPVYIDPDSFSPVDGVNTAFAYIDTVGIQSLKDGGAKKIKISAEGYYDTGIAGFGEFGEPDEYKPIVSDPKSYDKVLEIKETNNTTPENIYSIKRTDISSNKQSYLMATENDDNSWRLSAIADERKFGSFFVPSKLEISTDDTKESTANLIQYYPARPLNMASNTEEKLNKVEQPLKFNENGAYDGNYIYSVHKLAITTDGLQFKDGENVEKYYIMDMGELLPAIKEYSVKAGAKTIIHTVNVVGGNNDSKVYAAVYRVNDSKLLKMKKTTGIDNGNTVDYYDVSEVADNSNVSNDSSYQYEQMKNNYLQLTNDSSDIRATLRLKGLELGEKYRIVYFTYDKNKNITYLYSIDGKKEGYPYEIQTMSSINVSLSEISFNYVEYDNKYVITRPAISDSDGTGMVLYYNLINTSTNETVINHQKIEPLKAQGGEEYYSSTATKNNPIQIYMKPKDGLLKLNNEYKIELEAVDKEDNSIIIGTVSKTFTTPAVLKKPTFYITSSQVTSGTSEMAEANIVCTNTNRTIVGDKYKVKLYKNNLEGEALQTEEVTITGSPQTNNVKFGDVALEAGQQYYIQVEANVDENNKGTGTVYKQEIMFAANSTASATVTVEGNQKSLKLTLTNKQYFSNVTQIVVSAYKGGSLIYSETVPVNAEDVYTINWSKANITSGKYDIQLQYRDSSNNMLGNKTDLTVTIN